MTSTIYLAEYHVALGGRHSYLVYDPNAENNDTSDQRIIRGGPTGVFSLVELLTTGDSAGSILVEFDLPSDESLDGLDNIDDEDSDGYLNNDKDEDGVADSQADRNYTSLNLGSITWGQLVAAAAEVSTATLEYNIFGPNSNSVINSVLSLAGIDFRAVLPAGTVPSNYPGHMRLIDGTGDSVFTVFAYNNEQTVFHKQNGNDVLNVRTGGAVNVETANDNGGTTRIVLETIAFAQASVTTDLLDGDLLITRNADSFELVDTENHANLANPQPAGRIRSFDRRDKRFCANDCCGRRGAYPLAGRSGRGGNRVWLADRGPNPECYNSRLWQHR